LADQILDQIRAGDFGVGEKIPSENVLADRYGIGRPTVRQATETLIRRGYLVRRRGSGTYVAKRESHVDLFSLGGTLSSFSRQGFELSTRLEEAPTLVTEEGEHPLFGQLTYRMQRVGAVDEEPVLVETFLFDADVFPFFDQLKVAGQSLSEAVLARYRMEATSADQRFSVQQLEGKDAVLLGLPAGSPALLVERTLHFRAARGAVVSRLRGSGANPMARRSFSLNDQTLSSASGGRSYFSSMPFMPAASTSA
jgi:GntR family transcriptional regulator